MSHVRSRHLLVGGAEDRGADAYVRSIYTLPNPIQGTATIGDLWISPIKSLGMLWLGDGAYIGTEGLRTPDGRVSDRSVMLVVRSPGEVEGRRYGFERFSQRDSGHLVLAQPTYLDEKLVYESAGMDPLILYPSQLAQSDGEVVKVRMFKKASEICEGILEVGSVTAWVRQLLSTHNSRVNPNDVFALLQPSGFQRQVDAVHRCGMDVQTAYSDGGQILVTSRSTLEWMNNLRLGRRSIRTEAFRPNIELRGLPPNAEDLIGAMSAEADASIRMYFGGLCVRCPVPNIDPMTGGTPDKDPLAWLARNRPPRPDQPNSTTFGVNCVFAPSSVGKVVKPGMAFRVVSEKD